MAYDYENRNYKTNNAIIRYSYYCYYPLTPIISYIVAFFHLSADAEV